MYMLRPFAALAALTIALTACSGSGATASPSSPAAVSPAPASATVMLADSAKGKILVDGAGRTLYLFTADTGGKPSCYGGCATSWPPLLATGAMTPGAGMDAEDLAAVDRTDGGKQVTFYGQPVYYFSKDTKAGDLNGQGIGGKWFVVDSEGKPVK